MSAPYLEDERIVDLLVERSVDGLSTEAEKELRERAGEWDDFDPDVVERVATSLALNNLEPEPLPEHLEARIARDADIWMAGRQGATHGATVVQLKPAASSRPTRPEQPSARGFGGFWAVAAGVAVAAFGLWRADDAAREATEYAAQMNAMRAELGVLSADLAALRESPAGSGPGELRAALLDQNSTGIWSWSATEDEVAVAAAGDVVWNGERQEGYMRFVGLEPNAADQFAYQLWIFDESRDERYPVDGGVFDIPAGAGEVIVPIHPTLNVDRPVLFAITVEKPGGVMVSSRERIALVAKPDV